jgi:hypothetical protein
MFFYVQAALALLGVFIILRGRFPLGQQVVTRPIAPMVGALLAAPVPVCLWIGFVVGASHAFGPSAPGDEPSSVEDKILAVSWLDPLITAGFVSIAAVLAAVGRQDEEDPFPAAPANLADAQEKWAPTDPAVASDQVTATPRTESPPVEPDALVRPFTHSAKDKPLA